MSAPEQTVEQRSSVKISENSKGEPAVEVKVYTSDLDSLDAARERAVEVYKATRDAVRSHTPPASVFTPRVGQP